MHLNGDVPSALPKFPTGLNEAPISRISLGKLLANDAGESHRLFDACRTYGFFYMDLTDCPEGEELLRQSDGILALAKSAFKLPDEEKMSVHQSKTGSIFGFKAAGIIAATDPHKRKDRGEMFNIAKNDMLRETPVVQYPPTIMNAKPLVSSFNKNAHSVGMKVLELLADHLDITSGELTGRHRFTAQSGDHTRLTWGPGSNEPAPKTESDTPITTYAHTDFGSVTLLFNWLGGLQVENRDTGKWEWVRPISGCAIYNMGDAMVEFSGGRLASGKHRVLAAPGDQAALERYSIVYFVRPEDEVYLEDLSRDTSIAKDRQKITARDWINHKAQQIGNVLAPDNKS